ncbi:hypothetical protein [Pantoea agglomerans]|uniref:Uncharacterized protein n=1 Tax=Enterobacter agglomerans TaxID=549 RepID=A0ACC5PVT6_ENTAG|nr:hypothetical protein [Pantoea agglomerans]MBD8129278.1 hypothetical protein [Pantoea agglomerans]
MKNFFALLFLFSSASIAANPPININCGNDNYAIHFGNGGSVVLKNGELMESPSFSRKSYNGDLNAAILQFDQYGEQGGFHVHHSIVLSKGKSEAVLNKQDFDADNVARSDAVKESCTIKK